MPLPGTAQARPVLAVVLWINSTWNQLQNGESAVRGDIKRERESGNSRTQGELETIRISQAERESGGEKEEESDREKEEERMTNDRLDQKNRHGEGPLQIGPKTNQYGEGPVQ